jgi:hypothetical protein
MSDRYYYPEELLSVEEVLIHQTKEQLEKNYAQTTLNVYELTDEQAAQLFKAGVGSGSVREGNWVSAKTVLINGEPVLRIKFRGSHTQNVLPFTS